MTATGAKVVLAADPLDADPLDAAGIRRAGGGS